MIRRAFSLAALLGAGCGNGASGDVRPPGSNAPKKPTRASEDPAAATRPVPTPTLSTPQSRAREAMVRQQLVGRDIIDDSVLAAMRVVPRHEFVPEAIRDRAYADTALPIGHEVTISQPYIVALMTQLAQVERGDRVLDVGTGSGYQAAVLAEIGAQVWGIEIIAPLADEAAARLDRLGYESATVRAGDGYAGWPEHAPFDAIIIAAATPKVPAPLKAQLKVGGKLVAPVGADEWGQTLTVVTRTERAFDVDRVTTVAFVPMTGRVRE